MRKPARKPRIRLRREVSAFARAMEEKLRENDWKGGWDGCAVGWLLQRLYQELSELTQALDHGKPPAEVLGEAADVANFCMMLCDQYTWITEGRRREIPR